MIYDTVYYLKDLMIDNPRKVLLEDESKEGLIELVSNTFKKPLLKIYVDENELPLIEDKMKHFSFNKIPDDFKPSFGSFQLCIEQLGEL